MSIMTWLFTEYYIAWNSQVLRWNFNIPRATSYSVNSQATVPVDSFLQLYLLNLFNSYNPIFGT